MRLAEQGGCAYIAVFLNCEASPRKEWGFISLGCWKLFVRLTGEVAVC